VAPAFAVVCALALGGCATWLERPFAGLRPRPSANGVHPRGPTPPFGAPIPCRGGPFPSPEASDVDDAVTIGGVIFVGLGFHYSPDRFAPGAPPLTVPAIVPPNTRVVIAVAPASRGVAGLDSAVDPATTPAEAHRAVVCVTGPAQRVFDVTFVVRGARCVPIAVTGPGPNLLRTTTQQVAFGVRRCSP
jgi:hypothetical protein